MDDKQSLANQLGWCITTTDYLNNLNSEIRYVAQQYDNTVAMLRQSHYLAEMLPMIQQMQQDFDEHCVELIRHVEMEHLDYIQAIKKPIQTKIQKYVSNK